MNINETINSIANDIARQAERLKLYNEMAKVFDGVNIPSDTYIYFVRYSDGEIYCEFSPNGSDSKDLRPLVHSICRKFRTKFKKSHNWDKSALEYETKFRLASPAGDEVTYRVKVSGVVPSTCRYEEIVTPLSPEEIEEAKVKALESVKTERVERVLVCK